jgi:ribonuclease P protein component
MKYSYNKFEKLKSKKLIEQLFLEGNTVTHYPLRLTFIETSFDNDVKFKAGVSVSKRNFKKAVDRNKVKRLLREAYRLNKSMIFNNITTQNAFMILYLGNEIPNFKDLEIKMKQLFEKYLTKVSKQ